MSRSVFVRLAAALLIGGLAQPALAQETSALRKIGPLAKTRIPKTAGRSRVIVEMTEDTPPLSLDSLVDLASGRKGRKLSVINAHVLDLPNAALEVLARHPQVKRVSLDRLIVAANERTSATIGATIVRESLGYDGTGIGVAVIDSGITSWHDDLTASGGGQRVERFVDFVNGGETAYDDFGHGTHVAGIIGGNGYDSEGRRTGVAPGVSLIVLKALDSSGQGRISDVIAALDYVVAHKDALNIRVVNLSVATGVYESYETDPLTIAAKRAAEAGIVVVAAAGNNGRGATGHDQYGGIGAPGNAPWVLTVGASSHMGSVERSDDTMAVFSSRGPTAVDHAAKPDLVAPGVGIESLSDRASTLYITRSQFLLEGTVATPYLPYLSLSGTSMAAPVVSGTVALMLQANPSLTPNAVKAILQYTAQIHPAYDPLTEGTGFLNAKGAIELARSFNSQSSGTYPSSDDWGSRLIWGNRLVEGGRLIGDVNAWGLDVTWGAAATPSGAAVEWGVICTTDACQGNGAAWDPWRLNEHASSNVVWGSACGGADCTHDLNGDPVVWGTSEDDTVVWGTSDADTVVWGTSDDDTVVWGTSCGDPTCEPLVWPSASNDDASSAVPPVPDAGTGSDAPAGEPSEPSHP
jgi:subtilisin family serine protease